MDFQEVAITRTSTSPRPGSAVEGLFSCAVHLEHDCVLVYLDGELDMGAVECLNAVLDPLVAAGRNVIVDLSGLSFFGTAGLIALADLEARTTAVSGSIQLVKPSAAVRRVLMVTGTHNWFTIDAHIPEAANRDATPTAARDSSRRNRILRWPRFHQAAHTSMHSRRT
ncbi:STAS domain-containing protein [Mycobacterium paraintracellulare]|uniref:STAS domain-containing protein n=1 Tax=Mycobacterium paraintracellulare TaxID=1138383 RepID=UPI0019163532|nr:STAS domain-containing protein [Mycobacterium paraintracellulare]